MSVSGSEAPARLLVTGASGMLGANLVLQSVGRWHTIAQTHTHSLRSLGFEMLEADLTMPGAVEAVLRAARPDWVVHCAGLTDVDACEADPDLALRLNRDLAHEVARQAARIGAQMALISTDAVFSGAGGGYGENDPVAPVNAYGRSKAAGEAAARQQMPDCLILRTNFFGWPSPGKIGLAGWFLRRLSQGMPCRGFDDVYFNPLLASDLAKLILVMLERRLQGVWHIAGGECVSKYAFAVGLARTFGLDAGRIERSVVGDGELLAPRPRRLCLNVRKVERLLGRRMPRLAESLLHFAQERDNGYAAALAHLWRESAVWAPGTGIAPAAGASATA